MEKRIKDGIIHSFFVFNESNLVDFSYINNDGSYSIDSSCTCDNNPLVIVNGNWILKTWCHCCSEECKGSLGYCFKVFENEQAVLTAGYEAIDG